MSNSLNLLFDFFLPRFCPGCDRRLLHTEDSICSDCFNSIKKADDKRIQYEFDKNFRSAGHISDFTSLFIFEKDKTLQQIIHKLKYNQKFLLGKFLGKKLAETLAGKIKSWKIDLIVPVPLHRLKVAERGFNQSEYIAKGIAAASGLRMNKNILKRIRYTETQTMLNQRERVLNITDAFKLKNKRAVNGKIVLLVDDICTTGATLNECANVILKRGAKKVYVCSVAIAD